MYWFSGDREEIFWGEIFVPTFSERYFGSSFLLPWTFYNLFNEKLGDKLKFVFSPDVILCGWLGSKHQLTK